ncbi:MAG: SUMF1/EgtB/PvdO family nonheme iron enzyme, partial [Bacteroidota bacterium]
DFLNTLTYTQQAARTAASSPPNSAAGTGALISGNLNRNGIDIQTPGTNSTVPAVYACNLDDDGIYNESDDGQHIACNYLSWDDLDAYLDWAGLRPMTELEFEKSCRGNQLPVSGEYPWGSTSATVLTGISNAGLTNEIASNSGSNIAISNTYSTGPVRTGIFATGSSNRNGSGAGYYGNLDLGGNLWERVVTLGNNAGRAFSGNHGNGTLHSNGDADVVGWPDAAGTGWRGGAYDLPDSTAIASRRTLASNGNNSRVANAGGRGVKTISLGIVTDGLVLWLDAGVTASYPESGTTWTDLSGNRNNGTLINGIGFNNTNGGSLSFDGVNDYASIENSPTLNFSTAVSISIWFNSGTNQNKVLYLKGRTDVDNYNPLLRSNGFYAWTGISGRAQYLPPVDFIVNNTWYNLTVTHTSGSNPQIYKNGILATGYTYTEGNGTTALGTNGNPVSINADIPRGTIETFNGRIAIIIAYPRSLSSAEVLQNFNAQKARFGL